MIEHLKGKLVEINPASAVIEIGGVGYICHVTLSTYTQLKDQDAVLLYTHQVIREDAHLLYGFADPNERQMFRDLISVSGIGPNTARVILSSLSAQELKTSIVEEDITKLKSVKGVGAKSAERIVVDLKRKLAKEDWVQDILTLPDNTTEKDALSALSTLGFDRKKAKGALEKVLKQETDAITVEELIKKALKYL